MAVKFQLVVLPTDHTTATSSAVVLYACWCFSLLVVATMVKSPAAAAKKKAGQADETALIQLLASLDGGKSEMEHALMEKLEAERMKRVEHLAQHVRRLEDGRELLVEGALVGGCVRESALRCMARGRRCSRCIAAATAGGGVGDHGLCCGEVRLGCVDLLPGCGCARQPAKKKPRG